MNALTAFLNRLTSRCPALVLGCASVGTAGGWIGGMIYFSRQPRIFESHALLHPPGEQTGSRAIAWIETEAAAMQQSKHLEKAAEKAGLVKAWHRTPAECADLLKDAVRITVATMDHKNTMVDRASVVESDSDASAFSVLRVEMQGEKTNAPALCRRLSISAEMHGWRRN